MTTQLMGYPLFQAFDNSGDPLSGGLVYTYISGTTTPKITYTDNTGGTPNANPVVLNSRGEAAIWLASDNSYTYVIKDSAGTTLNTINNISGSFNPLSGGFAMGGNLQIKNYSITDNNQNEYLDFTTTTSAINEFAITNASIGTGPKLSVAGGDSNIDFNTQTKGTGKTNFLDGNANEVIILAAGTAGAVNEVTVTNAATGTDPSIAATGGDTNIAVVVKGKGTGAVKLGQATSTDVRLVADQPITDSSGNELLKFTKAASAVNEITISNAATGNGVSVAATGGDSNVAVSIVQKGAAAITFGAASCTGYTFTAGNITASAGDLVASAGTLTVSSPVTIANGGTSSTSASAARTALGLAIGTNVQAFDADLSAVAASGISTAALGSTLVSDGTSAVNPATLVGRNLLINGDMQVWQRGAGGSASIAVAASSTVYTADRWQVTTNANQASVVSQQAGATSGSFLLKYLRNSGQTGTGVVRVAQSLPRYRCIGCAGKKATLSFKAKCGANFSGGSITAFLYSGTGTSDISGIVGAFTGVNSELVVSPTLTTNLTNYSVTSATLGSSVTQLCIVFYIIPVGTAGADDSFSITDVQVEISDVQTPYERRGFDVELRDSETYYQKTFAYGTVPAQNAGSQTGYIIRSSRAAGAVQNNFDGILFSRPMRASPTLTTFSPGAASAEWYNDSATAAYTATTTYNTSAKGFMCYGTGSAGTAINQIVGLHYTADAELV